MYLNMLFTENIVQLYRNLNNLVILLQDFLMKEIYVAQYHNKSNITNTDFMADYILIHVHYYFINIKLI